MNEGGCNCGNPNHSLDNSSASTFDSDLGTSLHQYISLTSIYALNEDTLNSCQSIFKSYNDRFTLLPACSSDADDCELIIHVPFTEAVKLKYISIAGGQAETAPSSVKLFVNRNDVDFSNAHDLEPSQTLDLVNPDHHTEFVGTLDYAVKMNKFQSVSSLTLFFPANFGDEQTTLTYIGFKGQSTNTRHGIVDAVYESKPMMADHKAKAELGGAQNLT